MKYLKRINEEYKAAPMKDISIGSFIKDNFDFDILKNIIEDTMIDSNCYYYYREEFTKQVVSGVLIDIQLKSDSSEHTVFIKKSENVESDILDQINKRVEYTKDIANFHINIKSLYNRLVKSGYKLSGCQSDITSMSITVVVSDNKILFNS